MFFSGFLLVTLKTVIIVRRVKKFLSWKMLSVVGNVEISMEKDLKTKWKPGEEKISNIQYRRLTGK